VVAGYLLVEAQQWSFSARIGPTVVASTAIIAGAVSLVFVIFSNRGVPKPEGTGEEDDVYMDLRIDTGDNLTPRTIVMRAGMFFAWVLGFLLVMALIGMIPAIAVMIIAFMRIEGREPWKLCIVNSAAATALVYVVFDQIIRVPWPSTVLGALVPPLAAIIPSV
jgi:predicted outer membrane lipoprotein